jgi:dipeptidyl aminopeptidase/acylaminoacyl peptidase
MFRVFVFCAVTAFCGFTWAQEYTSAPLLDRELFFADPEYSSFEISPDGKYISFLRSVDKINTLWIKGINESMESACPITPESVNILNYCWSGDGRCLLYTREVEELKCFHLFAVQLPETIKSPPKAKDLTPFAIVSPRYLGSGENPEIVYVSVNLEGGYPDIYSINLYTGETNHLFSNTEKIGIWYFDKTGCIRLVGRESKSGKQYEIFRVEGESITPSLIPLLSYDLDETFEVLEFHKDGKRFYANSSLGPNVDRSRLVLVDIETGKSEECESDPEGVADLFTCMFEDEKLAATSYMGEKKRLYCKSEKMKRVYEIFRESFPIEDLYFWRASDDGRYRLVYVCSDVEPGSIYLYDAQKEAYSFLYCLLPHLPSEHLCSTEPIQYRSRDGLLINGYLTLPKGLSNRNLPLVVYPHGGPHVRDYWGYDPFTQFFANRGYAVFQMNFRGSRGYGKKFLSSGYRQWGDAMQNDITDGVEYLIEKGISDRSRIGIFGASYGGFAALAGLTFTPRLYRCCVCLNGPSSLRSLVKSPYASSYPLTPRRLGDLNSGRDRTRRKKFSPLYSAGKVRAPLLLIQGSKDPRVPKKEAEQMAKALKKRDKKITYLSFPKEQHSFSKKSYFAVALRVERFFAKYLGGRYQKEYSESLRKQFRVVVHKHPEESS